MPLKLKLNSNYNNNHTRLLFVVYSVRLYYCEMIIANNEFLSYSFLDLYFLNIKSLRIS